MATGCAADAVAALQAVVAEHPERERARGLLMQALYRSGRHTDALATFRSWRQHLSEDLGLDPSPALERIEQDILRHALPSPDSRPEPPGRALLPLPVTSFIGRDEDRLAVTELLGHAAAHLARAGGVGKTKRCQVLLVLDNCEHVTDAVADHRRPAAAGDQERHHPGDQPGTARDRRRARLAG